MFSFTNHDPFKEMIVRVQNWPDIIIQHSGLEGVKNKNKLFGINFKAKKLGSWDLQGILVEGHGLGNDGRAPNMADKFKSGTS